MVRSKTTDLSFEDKTADIYEISRAINNSQERDQSFWKTQFTQAKDNFDASVSEVHETRKTVIEFVKIDILVGSLIVAVYQYGIIDPTTISAFYVGLPFIALLGSAIAFIHTYFALGTYVIGPSSGGYLEILKEEHTEKEYYRIMTTVHYKWADKNTEVNHDAQERITAGISLLFVSLGFLSGMYVFI